MFNITEPIVSLLGIGLEVSGSASLTGESALTANAAVATFAEASLSAQSDLSATLTLVAAADTALSSDSTLVANETMVLLASTSMSAQSHLIAGLETTWEGAAALSAQSNLTADAGLINLAIALVAGTSNLTAQMGFLVPASPRAMRASSGLTVTMFISAPVAGRPMVAGSNFFGTLYEPKNYLVLPTVELAYTDNILLKRYPIDNGQSLLITNNIGSLVSFPAQEEIANADYYFRGGSTNILDDEAEAAVVAAGYGDYIVTE